MHIPVLEGCVESLSSAKIAAANGCTRLELCQNLVIGGTTPSPALFAAVRKACDLPIRVLIRPRFGDFLYDAAELAQILVEIRYFLNKGAQGVVVGQLTADGDLDREALARMREAAGHAGMTLHRAFDLCREPFYALETAVELGFDTILTSGQAETAQAGAALLRDLSKAAAGRIQIMAGSGVNAAVISELSELSGLRAFHLSATVKKDSPMRYRKAQVHMGLPGLSEYTRLEADAERFRAAAEALTFAEIKDNL